MRTLGMVIVVSCCLSLVGRAQDYKAYQNYDFVAGDRILVEDDFRADADGEFPAHWRVSKGQGAVNTFQGEPALVLTEGNYVQVAPRMKNAAYLGDSFTVELDFYPKAGGFEKIGVMIVGDSQGDEQDRDVFFGNEVSTANVDPERSGSYPGGPDAFVNKWHHLALIYRNGQVKAYEDQNRVLVAPDFGEHFTPKSLYLAGIGDPDNPLILKNVRIAAGGGMNVLQALSKDGKVVSHILFAVNSAAVKPESMGAIQEMVKALKADPSIKIEIDGHTDSDGDAARNVALSQSRAESVKKIMVEQGVDAARMTAKGYGATKPLGPNDSPEGKANNRRVEFIKL